MTQLRERWEGVSLPGEYLLKKWLSGDENAGLFETSLPPDGRRAVVKLVPESAVDATAQLALWQRTRPLRHPHLQELLDCGRAELAGEVALYAVFESSDDTLASALAHAPLSETEAREVLDAVVKALGYLQSQGLTHAAIDPDQVLAVGDAIKLSADALHEAPPAAPFADEVRAFWNKISPSTPPKSAEILAQALGEDLPAAVPPPPAPPLLPAPVHHSRDIPPPKPFPKWILVGAAAVVLLILGLNLRRTPEAPAPPAIAPASVPAAAPAETKLSPLAEEKPAVPAKPAPRVTPAATTPATPAPSGKGMWRVVAFTYRTHPAAVSKAEQINAHHPELQAAVLAARGKKGSYLIVLGGPMSREDAERMEKKARAARVVRSVSLQNDLN